MLLNMLITAHLDVGFRLRFYEKIRGAYGVTVERLCPFFLPFSCAHIKNKSKEKYYTQEGEIYAETGCCYAFIRTAYGGN